MEINAETPPRAAAPVLSAVQFLFCILFFQPETKLILSLFEKQQQQLSLRPNVPHIKLPQPPPLIDLH